MLADVVVEFNSILCSSVIIFRFRLVDLPPLFYDKCLVNPSYVGSRRQYPPIAIAGSLKSRLIMKFLVDS